MPGGVGGKAREGFPIPIEFVHGAQTIIATNIGQVRLKFTVDPKTERNDKENERIASNAEHFPSF